MKQNDKIEKLKSFISECQKDKDGFVVFHFDTKEKKLAGFGEEIDQTKALIVIKHVAMKFGITPQTVIEMLTREQKIGKQKLIKLPGLTKPDGKTPLN